MDVDERLFVFADPSVRDVFSRVLKDGRISLGDLKRDAGNDVDVDSAIDKLREGQFIEMTTSPIAEFSTVYPTSDGFRVAQKLRFEMPSFSSGLKSFIS